MAYDSARNTEQTPSTRSETSPEHLHEKIEHLNDERERLRTRVSSLESENDRLADEIHLLFRKNFASRTSSSFSAGTWIPAELDVPSEMTKKTAIRYERKQSVLRVQNTHDIRSEGWGYYAKLPSRTSRTIHVFIECATNTVGSYRRLCVLSHTQPPQGFVPYSTIHLKRLGPSVAFKVLFGRIDKLYIVLDADVLETPAADEKRAFVRMTSR